MRKLDIKSLIIGIIIGLLSVTTVTASQIKIKSSQYNETKIIYKGEELQLSQPMVTVVNEGSQYGSNYMPVRAVLEALDYKVDWDGGKNAVIIKDGDIINNQTSADKVFTKEEYDNFINNFKIENIKPTENDNSTLVQKFIYDGDLTSQEIVDYLIEYPNRHYIIEDIINKIDIGSHSSIYISFRYHDSYTIGYYQRFKDNQIVMSSIFK